MKRFPYYFVYLRRVDMIPKVLHAGPQGELKRRAERSVRNAPYRDEQLSAVEILSDMPRNVTDA